MTALQKSDGQTGGQFSKDIAGHGQNVEWTAGAILTATTEGGKLIPGYIKHPFGMDLAYLAGEDVWVIHHIPTGYAIAAVDGDTAAAVKVVDVLLTLGDWQFDKPEGAKQYSGALKAAREAGLPVISPNGVKRIVGPNAIKATGASS
ncbi:hypothetical protein TomTYG75_06860 [Sphingobium sp. TomTYG75]